MKYDNIGKMPDTRDPKWGAMKAGESHLSDEWHEMEASECHTSEKWIEQRASTPHMSEKWVDICADESPNRDRWHEMKQEGRDDAYSMNPSSGDRTVGMKSQESNSMKNRGHGRYEVSGSEGQSGKGL